MTPLKSSHPRGTYVAVCSVHIGRDLYNCLIPAGCAAPSGTSLHRIPVTRSPGELGWVVSGWLQTVKVQPGLSASASSVIWWSKRARGNGSSRPRQGQGGSSSPCTGKGVEAENVANAGRRGAVGVSAPCLRVVRLCFVK